MADPKDSSQSRTVRLESAASVIDEAAALANQGFGLAMIVATDETQGPDRDFKLRWIFEPVSAPPLDDCFVTLLASIDPARPEAPSLTLSFPAANWHEREAQDLFGIHFTGHLDPRPLVVHDGWPEGRYPLRKDFDVRTPVARLATEQFPHLRVEGEGVFEVPVGPIHAGIIEPGHFRFSSIGEAVIHFEARLFYTHRGMEKRAEGLSAIDAFHVAERMCGVCSVAHGLGFCEAVERIAVVEAPSRARVLRAVALELERLYNHSGDVGNLCAGASYHYGTSVGLRIKEALQRLNEQVTGSRFLRGLLIPGGVRRDISAATVRAIGDAVDRAAVELADLIVSIEANPSVVDRLEGTGRLARDVAKDLGATGVAARASGIDRDARRDHPHAAFADQGAPRPRVVTATEGDVHARLRVRAEEVQDSARLVRELLAGMRPGPIVAAFPESLPPWGIAIGAVESPRGAALHWVGSDGAGRIARYHVRSASYANWPAVPFAAQGGIIPDFPLINKSFELCYSCTDR